MRQHSVKDRGEPRPTEENIQAANARRALERWWETLSAEEQWALQGPERRRRGRRVQAPS
jgi:hypothetical protein